jgi:hypothetical protein
MLRYEVPNFPLDLPNAIHGQQRGAESFATILLQQPGPEDDVRLAGFVFNRDEQHAFRGAWSLPYRHDAACAGELAVAQQRELARWWQSLQAAFSFPSSHGAPQLVSLARCEPCGEHRDLHDLLLKNQHAHLRV